VSLIEAFFGVAMMSLLGRKVPRPPDLQ